MSTSLIAAAKIPSWLLIALGELCTGVQEIAGKIHNPRILEYHTATSLKASDDETPWCSAFVNFCLSEADYEGTRNAAARSFLDWKHGDTVAIPASPAAPIRPGTIAIFKRGHSSWQGHVGIALGRSNIGNIILLGGNQSDAVTISIFSTADLLGLRWPKVGGVA